MTWLTLDVFAPHRLMYCRVCQGGSSRMPPDYRDVSVRRQDWRVGEWLKVQCLQCGNDRMGEGPEETARLWNDDDYGFFVEYQIRTRFNNAPLKTPFGIHTPTGEPYGDADRTWVMRKVDLLRAGDSLGYQDAEVVSIRKPKAEYPLFRVTARRHGRRFYHWSWPGDVVAVHLPPDAAPHGVAA